MKLQGLQKGSRCHRSHKPKMVSSLYTRVKASGSNTYHILPSLPRGRVTLGDLQVARVSLQNCRDTEANISTVKWYLNVLVTCATVSVLLIHVPYT